MATCKALLARHCPKSRVWIRRCLRGLQKSHVYELRIDSERWTSLYERGDFRRDEIYASSTEKILHAPGLANTGVSYYGSHVEPDINDEPHVYKGPDGYGTIEGYTAHVVGGGTQLYGAVSLRFYSDRPQAEKLQRQSPQADRPRPKR